jgi:hypothetical protein
VKPADTFVGKARAVARQALRAPTGALLRAREPFAARRVRHELAICAIFREEAPFLDEWLTFHHGVGATHFYLYNNGSTDDYTEVLQPWRERGIVTLIDWPGAVQQLPAYTHCVQHAARDCRWIAFLDIDEFLFSPAAADIRPILARYRDLPGLAVWAAFFGSGGRERRPAAPVTLSYRMRGRLAERRSVKTIANPRFVYKTGVHEFKFWRGAAQDTARRPIRPGMTPVLDTLRINHYWSRSLEDLATKVARGDASTNAARDAAWHFAYEQTLNSERDESIVPIAEAVLRRA